MIDSEISLDDLFQNDNVVQDGKSMDHARVLLYSETVIILMCFFSPVLKQPLIQVLLLQYGCNVAVINVRLLVILYQF